MSRGLFFFFPPHHPSGSLRPDPCLFAFCAPSFSDAIFYFPSDSCLISGSFPYGRQKMMVQHLRYNIGYHRRIVQSATTPIPTRMFNGCFGTMGTASIQQELEEGAVGGITANADEMVGRRRLIETTCCSAGLGIDVLSSSLLFSFSSSSSSSLLFTSFCVQTQDYAPVHDNTMAAPSIQHKPKNSIPSIF